MHAGISAKAKDAGTPLDLKAQNSLLRKTLELAEKDTDVLQEQLESGALRPLTASSCCETPDESSAITVPDTLTSACALVRLTRASEHAAANARRHAHPSLRYGCLL